MKLEMIFEDKNIYVIPYLVFEVVECMIDNVVSIFFFKQYQSALAKILFIFRVAVGKDSLQLKVRS